jgi:membrane protein implicated in regulation of membrane protease activity
MVSPYLWLLLGILLVVGELLIGGFVLLAVAVGCVVAAAAATVLGWPGQLVAASVGTALALVFARPLSNRLGFRGRTPTRTNVDALPGKTGVILEAITPDRGYGRVAVGGDDWRARGDLSETLEKGTRVLVVGVDGATLVVVREPELRS